MDVYDYFDQFQRLCESRSLDWTGVTFAALEGTDDLRGRLTGLLTFEVGGDVTAYLKVNEVIEIIDNKPIRIEYGYFLIIDRTELWGEELDLSHEPPIHRHGRYHERMESEGITFAAAVDLAWNDVAEHLERLAQADTS